MIKPPWQYILAVILLFILCIGSLPNTGHAQFIDLQLNIDSKLTSSTQQQLEFGTMVTNSGWQTIELGSLNMGIFSITGLENQTLLIDLQKPDQLLHDNPAIERTVPLQLFARYGYSAQEYQDSTPLTGNTARIKVDPNPNPGPWNTIYLFIYGSVDIGNIPEGMYSNEIVLNIEYM